MVIILLFYNLLFLNRVPYSFNEGTRSETCILDPNITGYTNTHMLWIS